MLLHPSSASGRTLGDFIPGRIEQIFGIDELGAFITMYLLPRPLLNALMRKRNLSSNCCLASLRFLFAISTASLFIMASTSFNPFIMSVLPVLTISKIPSASPIPVAISTLPPSSSIFTSMPLTPKYFLSIFG
ncbi:hypothetical protein SDC9_93597 [bioreactor metagenome]|uniref:Uncharacterized protein n=1 Tax=bioreactor metagenome TaxID=1076179 RepID=A0A645A116_9ZZZZ